ncbi:ModD protein [Pyrobaculum neutrophilum]|uniref:Nicotinate-nucleotide pyrophosphorylase [carboxylating] n=1 Tax=Pyrobaculum neutrophilum (strain DSM 2338 / JCM 9278 / NBRC 100436 / V24Sta) TaxID=444157 RepID=B1YDQ1_PYRNV|nr:ModD protein [Pyrobaculum neutrophilum]ACB39914.1 modD protein [Pyrobaculum neutrophilum V24Sta]
MKSRLEAWLLEDLGSYDLTTEVLGIGGLRGVAQLFAREEAVVAGSEEAAEVYKLAGCGEVEVVKRSGQLARRGDVVLRAVGEARCLHAAWRTAQEVVAWASGVATKTRRLVELARRVNPRVVVAATRKTPPGLRALYHKAVLAGGGMVHRCCLSDGVLVFRNHLVFLGEGALQKAAKAVAVRPAGVEVSTVEEAVEAAKAGFSYIQLERMTPEEVAEAAARVRAVNPRVVVGASGGIDEHNIASYAPHVDVVVTSAPYRAPPIDLGTEMAPL